MFVVTCNDIGKEKRILKGSTLINLQNFFFREIVIDILNQYFH